MMDETDLITAALVRRVARRVSRLEREQREQARASQARDRSLEGGAQLVYDDDDELRTVVGEQADGTFTVTTYGGAAPEAPSAPLVAQVAGGATITWDGYDHRDELGWPANMAGVKVYLSTVPGELPSQDTYVGLIAGDEGGAFTVAQPADVTTYCTLTAVTDARVESAPSVEVEMTGGSTTGEATRTTSTVPPPGSTFGYPEGFQWWQILAGGALEGVWEVIGSTWEPLELLAGQAGYQTPDVAWRRVGSIGEPAYENGWHVSFPDFVEFRKHMTGEVSLVGRASPGSTGTTVFTLPAGYRPSRDLTDVITKSEGAGNFSTLDFLTDGRVVARSVDALSTWVSLTVSFPTD
jgi:hypothetical protein